MVDYAALVGHWSRSGRIPRRPPIRHYDVYHWTPLSQARSVT
jgi:hypothetical protein